LNVDLRFATCDLRLSEAEAYCVSRGLCVTAGLGVIVASTIVWLTVFPALRSEPLSDDVYYHMLTAREMVRLGQVGLLEDEWFLAPEGRVHVYPPFFHWILVGLSWGDTEKLEEAAVAAQWLLGPLALLAFFLLALEVLSPLQALLALVLLAVSFPFGARTHLAVPEAVEHIAGPLLLLAWLKRREWLCGLLLLILFLNHSMTPFLMIAGLLAHAFLERRRDPSQAKRVLAPILLVASVGIVLQLISAWMNASAVHFDDDKLRPTLGFVLRAYFNPVFGTSCMLVPLGFGLWGLWRHRSDSRFLLMALAVAAHLPTLMTYSGRFAPYALVPLCLAAARVGGDLLPRVARPAAALVTIVLLAVQTWSSFHLYKYNYDFTRPSDRQQGEFLRSAQSLVPEAEIVCVDELFYAYRVAWYMQRNTTMSALECREAGFRYSVARPMSSPWVPAASSGAHMLYARDL